jgi:hypothetical protein
VKIRKDTGAFPLLHPLNSTKTNPNTAAGLNIRKDTLMDRRDSFAALDIFPERDSFQVATGRWCWEVTDAKTNGPIIGGVEFTKEEAKVTGQHIRAIIQRRDYF